MDTKTAKLIMENIPIDAIVALIIGYIEPDDDKDVYGYIKTGFYEKCIDIEGAYFGIRVACAYGHIDIVKLMINNGAKIFNICLEIACRSGHMDIIKLMIEYGANNWDMALIGACQGGNIDIVKFISELKLEDFDSTKSSKSSVPIASFYIGGTNVDTMDVINYSKRTWNDGLIAACEHGHVDIAEYMISLGADNISDGFLSACQSGHVDVVKLMVKYGATLFTTGLTIALEENHAELATLMVSYHTNIRI